MNQTSEASKILSKYWGYDSFRNPQDEIIQTLLAGNDTLAVLPTGAGKSICFQVPALVLGGVTLVITPLIALMADQVQQLKKRQINAFALHSGLPKDAQNTILNQVKALPYCLLYLSPEKLHSQWFQENISGLNVQLLAIDEAHCISQWGYDFRPEYLKIREATESLICKKIALTASATPLVQKDIVEKLGFERTKVFSTSTFRANLSYKIVHSDDKDASLLRCLKQAQGSTIVYVRSRKMCHEIAKVCLQNGISSQVYHAGLSRDIRHDAQQQWLDGKAQVMVATNAFGMGIDKADVRNVLHYGAPNALEAYYQEAGRAGRDQKESTVYLFIGSKDKSIAHLQNQKVYQPLENVRSVFQAICNILQLAEGFHLQGFHILDIEGIKKRTQLEFVDIHYSLKLLDLSQILKYEEDFYTPSKLLVLVSAEQLFQLYQTNPTFEKILKAIIRIYGADVYEDEQIINESSIARMAEVSIQKIIEVLNFLKFNKVIRYFKGTDQPVIQFLMPRPSVKSLPLDVKLIQFLKERAEKQIDDMYAFGSTAQCKQQFLAEYFGGSLDKPCGKCSSCEPMDWALIEKIKNKISQLGKMDLEQIKELSNSPIQLSQILNFMMLGKQIKRDEFGFFRLV